MDWWIWVLAGLVLMAVEVAIPGGVILLFFGVAALLVGVLVALGVGGPVWWQALLFSALSVLSLVTLRGPILRRLKASSDEPDTVDTLLGQQVVLQDELAPGAEGKAELRGTSWIACNLSDERLERGRRCVIERVEGLKLFIRGR